LTSAGPAMGAVLDPYPAREEWGLGYGVSPTYVAVPGRG
jgi:hypothetical protein